MTEPIPIEDLHALADNELPMAERDRLMAAMRDHPEAQREYESIVAMKQALQGQRNAHTSEELWRTCRARLQAIESTQRTERFVWRNAWAISACVFLVLVSAAWLQRSGPRSVRAQEVAMLASGMFPSGSSHVADPKRFGQWFEKEVGAPKIPAGPLVPVAGVAGTFHGARVARIVLQDQRGTVSFVLVHNPSVAGRTECSQMRYFCVNQMRNMNAVAWLEPGYEMMLVGDRSQADLLSIAEQLRDH